MISPDPLQRIQAVPEAVEGVITIHSRELVGLARNDRNRDQLPGLVADRVRFTSAHLATIKTTLAVALTAAQDDITRTSDPAVFVNPEWPTLITGSGPPPVSL